GLAAPIHREEVFRETGLHRYSVATRNGAPLFNAHTAGKVVIAADPATLTETPIEEVIATGAGSFASTGSLRMIGMEKRAAMKVTLKVTGPGQAISGIPVVEVTADVALQVPPPMGRIESRVKGYLMPDLGYYITGELMGGTFFDAARTPHRPMALSLPGSTGFQTTKPAYCGGGLGLLDPALTPAPALGGAA
ncbi:MAG: hypothetical protein B7Y02_17945, partial [Rhodobacterales bacterium 17-64-5]